MTPVLILAAGAGWETTALGVLERAPGLVVLRRCVDVDDLAAAASAGQAEAAVVALDAPGLDARVIDVLRHHGVRVVGVLPAGPAADPARAAAGRAGIGRVVAEDDLDALPAAVAASDLPAPDLPAPGPGAATHVRAAGPAGAANAAGTANTDRIDGRPGVPMPVPAPVTGRLLAVWGPAGAPGRSTVAAAIAAELARRRRPVLLVDADPYGGAIAQQLGILDEVSGLLAAARGGLGPATRLLGTHLAVLTGLPRPDRWPELRAGVLSELLDQGRSAGEVVVDTGFSLEEPADPTARAGRNQLTLEALEAADEVVVVGSADPVGLSRLARGLVDLQDRVPGVPVRVVVNRMRPSLGWSERDVAGMVAGLVRPVGLHFLPEDRTAVDRALVAGRTLAEAAPDSPLGRAVASLVADLLPEAADPAPGASATATRRRAGRARRR
jgi:MinD-like ATPase involved in chromosome partitioning or flagellar assembly